MAVAVRDRRIKTYLRLDNVPYPHLGHDRDRHGIDDLLDHFGVALQCVHELRTMFNDPCIDAPYELHRHSHECQRGHVPVPLRHKPLLLQLYEPSVG